MSAGARAWGRMVVGLVVGAAVLVGLGCSPGDTPNSNDNTPANTNDNQPANTNDNTPGNGNGNDNSPAPALASFETELFRGPSNCAICHEGLTDEAAADVSIATEWRATVVANAAKDPGFLAKTESEVNRIGALDPALAAEIEDSCATCHLPMARTQSVADGEEVVMLGEGGYLDSANALHEAAMDGVSCTVCHQIQATGLGEAASFSGGFVIDADSTGDRELFGPYADPDQTAMLAASGYLPVLGEHIKEAALCGACHTLYTPTVSAAGEVVGEFPEQTPFLEWLHSAYSDGEGEDRVCQDCHMPVAEGGVVIATAPSGMPTRSPFHRHQFVSGNVQLLRILRDNVAALGLGASAAQFEAAIARSEAHVQSSSVEVEITGSSEGLGLLALTVQVRNLAGHKFPTGFPSRRAWLYVQVADADGELLYESGRWDGDGQIEGADSDADAAAIEAHHILITSPFDVQIYESIMQDTDGAATYTLLRADAYAKDNRLLPAGFDKATADADIAVIGGAATDGDFVAGMDEVGYLITLADGAARPITVTIDLMYQSMSYRYVEDLLADDSSLVNEFRGMYDVVDKTPVRVAGDSVTLE